MEISSKTVSPGEGPTDRNLYRERPDSWQRMVYSNIPIIVIISCKYFFQQTSETRTDNDDTSIFTC